MNEEKDQETLDLPLINEYQEPVVEENQAQLRESKRRVRLPNKTSKDRRQAVRALLLTTISKQQTIQKHHRDHRTSNGRYSPTKQEEKKKTAKD